MLPRRRQLLICRKSGEVLQWDVPSLATSLAEGACNALVEKELSKMTPQHQHEEASAIYPPYQHEQHEELRSSPSPSKALGTGGDKQRAPRAVAEGARDDKQRGACSRRGRLEARETFGAAVRALGAAATAAEEHWVDGMEWLRGADDEEEAEAAAEAEEEAQAAQALARAQARAQAEARARAQAQAEEAEAAAEEEAEEMAACAWR